MACCVARKVTLSRLSRNPCVADNAPAVAPIVKSRCRTGLLARQLHLNDHNERFLTQSFIYSYKAGCSILFSPKRTTILRIIYSSFASKQEMQRHEKRSAHPLYTCTTTPPPVFNRKHLHMSHEVLQTQHFSIGSNGDWSEIHRCRGPSYARHLGDHCLPVAPLSLIVSWASPVFFANNRVP